MSGEGQVYPQDETKHHSSHNNEGHASPQRRPRDNEHDFNEEHNYDNQRSSKRVKYSQHSYDDKKTSTYDRERSDEASKSRHHEDSIQASRNHSVSERHQRDSTSRSGDHRRSNLDEESHHRDERRRSRYNDEERYDTDRVRRDDDRARHDDRTRPSSHRDEKRSREDERHRDENRSREDERYHSRRERTRSHRDDDHDRARHSNHSRSEHYDDTRRHTSSSRSQHSSSHRSGSSHHRHKSPHSSRVKPRVELSIPEQLAALDPYTARNASFVWNNHPLLQKIIASAKTNFVAAQQPPSQQKQQQGDRQQPQEQDSVGSTVATNLQRPNYFTTSLLSTTGGGSVYKGPSATTFSSVPGRGFTAQAAINYADQSAPLKVFQVDASDLSAKGASQSVIAAAIAAASTTSSDPSNTQIQQSASSFFVESYKQPVDSIIPQQIQLPSSIPTIQVWTLAIFDTSLKEYIALMDFAAEGDSIKMEQLKSEEGAQQQQQRHIAFQSKREELQKQLRTAHETLSLRSQSLYRLGSDSLQADICFDPIPPTAIPQFDDLPGENLSPEAVLATSRQVLDLNNTIEPIHCFVQFRRRVRQTTASNGQVIDIPVAVPYILDPSTKSRVFFKQQSTDGTWRYEAIQQDRFVEILPDDIITLGKSCYELVFLMSDVPNPNANLYSRQLLD